MRSFEELVAAVDAAFIETGRGLDGWPDPHPDRRPLEDEYSRVTNPQRWKILAARAEAWFAAMTAAGIAETEEAAVAWREQPRIPVAYTFRAVPLAPNAIPLVIAWNRIEDVEWPALVLGAGDPTEVVAIIPDCACDACDSGSQDALDELDEYVLGVVTGSYRKLRRGRREITVYSKDHMSWSGFERRRVSLWRLLPGRFVGVPTAATPEMIATGYYTTKPSNFQKKPKWLHALVKAIVDKLVNNGSSPKKLRRKRSRRRKVAKKVERVLARPRKWHQLQGSPWIGSDNQEHGGEVIEGIAELPDPIEGPSLTEVLAEVRDEERY